MESYPVFTQLFLKVISDVSHLSLSVIFCLAPWEILAYSFDILHTEKHLGCIFLRKILIRILNPKTDFLFLWQNPKRDFESNESVRDEDSMD